MEFLESPMEDQIEGLSALNTALCDEANYLEEMLRWAYSKLYGRTFSNMEDALMADRIKLWIEHGIAG